jgi:hypothetical protein
MPFLYIYIYIYISRIKQRVVGTVTVVGFSVFRAVIRFSAIIVPSLNDTQIHGCLVFHVVPEVTTRNTLFSVMAARNQMLLMTRAKKQRETIRRLILTWQRFPSSTLDENLGKSVATHTGPENRLNDEHTSPIQEVLQ